VKTRGPLGAMLLVFGLGFTPSMAARALPGPDDERVEGVLTEQAKQLYKDGVKETAQGNWDKGRDLFLAAFRLKPHFQIAFNLGQAELRSGQPLQAAEHLSLFLAEAPKIAPSDRQIAWNMLQEAQQKIGTLEISADQPGAEIIVNGVFRGKTPLDRDVFVAPGKHVLEARLDGYQRLTQVATATAGASSQVQLQLSKVAGKEGGVSKVVVIGGVSAGVIAGLGAMLLVGSAVKAGERGPVQLSCSGDCDRYRAAEDARRGLSDAAFYTFVAAGLIGTGTLVYALVAPDFKPTVKVSVLAGPGVAGVQATGRW
jgi:hypothetical protein